MATFLYDKKCNYRELCSHPTILTAVFRQNINANAEVIFWEIFSVPNSSQDQVRKD